jgi:tripartite-type tricarboxylate transporter receptor subunit TctC
MTSRAVERQRCVKKDSNGMTLGRRRFLHLAAGAAALPVAPRLARAQAYPSRPITAVVAFAAGGSGDTIARIMGDHMRKTLGQTIVVENVGGAAGTIGTGRVARAAPDGYTVIFGNWPTHVLNGAIYPLTYHVLNDFEPVAMLATESIVIVGKKALPPNNLKGLIAWLKDNPNKASAGTTGAGGVGHVIGLFFQKETGTQFQFVPYRGVGPAMQDLVSGQIDIMFDTSANSLPQVRGGTIKGFAVTSQARLESAPNLPTVDEAGLPGFHISNWRGLWAPKGTPKDVIAKLNDAVVKALADPDVRKRLGDLGQEIPPREQQTPEALAKYQKADIERWWPVIKAAKIKPN